ncbi:MAG TPA: hypothetical protein VG937_05405 [Polyangiaceae bacterium]|nr:hypothetical protein [Polyangiaceae bacterium]
MSDESVSKKPPEVESTSQSTIIDGAAGELDREIALHLPPATDAELEAAMHSPTQATSPSLRRIARSRARSRQAWLLAALFAGFSCIALLWMSLFPSGSAGSGPEPRVSIESSRTAGALPLAVPAVQTATAPEQMPERALEPARVEAEVPAAPSIASSPSAIEPTSEVAPSARGAVSNTSSSTPRVPAMPRPRLDKPNVPEEVAPSRTRENAAAASSLSPAPAPSSKFVFQPQ